MNDWVLDGHGLGYYDYSRTVVEGGGLSLELVLTMDLEGRSASIKPRLIGEDIEPDIPSIPIAWGDARDMLGDVPFAYRFEPYVPEWQQKEEA